jgi:CheY-like chemotaxis protein
MSRMCTSGPCAALAQKRVLIVDDDDDARDLMRFILEARGMKVSDSASALDGLAELDRSDFDLLISDIGMPEIDGYSFIRAVRGRKKHADLPAVAVTAFTRLEDRAQALLAGFDVHIGKPCDVVALIPTLTGLLATGRRSA